MTKYKLILLCIMWLSCGMGLLGKQHSLVNFIMIIGAIYITHHICGFKI